MLGGQRKTSLCSSEINSKPSQICVLLDEAAPIAERWAGIQNE
jgi:hypothetical protein